METTPSISVYETRRKWGDLFIPSMNQMAAELLQRNALLSPSFLNPTVNEDRRLGIDQYIDVDRIKLSYRTRKFNALPYVLEGFTLRKPSELQKVMKGIHADYLLYAVASEEDDGSLLAGILIDLKSVGEQLNRFPSILEKASHHNDFVDFSYDLFPYEVCVGWWGVKRKEEWQDKLALSLNG